MIKDILDANQKTVHRVDSTQIVKINGGVIVFDANGSGQGTITGSNITLLSGQVIQIEPMEFGKVFQTLRKLGRI